MNERQAINQLSIHISLLAQGLEYIIGKLPLANEDKLEFCLTLKTIKAEADEIEENTEDSE